MIFNKIMETQKEITQTSQTNLGLNLAVKKLITDKDFKIFFNLLNKPSKSEKEVKTIEQYLSKIDSLRALLYPNPQDMLKTISEHIRAESYQKNQLIVKYGEKATKFFIIIKGSVNAIIPYEYKEYLTESEYETYLKLLFEFEEFQILSKCEHLNANITKNTRRRTSRKFGTKILPPKDEKDPRFTTKKESNMKLSPQEYIERINFQKNNPPSKDRNQYSLIGYISANNMYQGENFGNVALHSESQTRTATIISNEDCILGILDKESYNSSVKEANSRIKKFNIEFLLKNNIFETLDKDKFVSKYFTYFSYKSIENFQYLINEGEEPKFIYFIIQGEFELSFKKSLVEIKKIVELLSEPKPSSNNDDHIKDNQYSFVMLNFLKEKKIQQYSITTGCDIFGLPDCYSDNKSIFNIKCLKQAKFMKIPYKIFMENLQQDPIIRLNTENILYAKKKLIKHRLQKIYKTKIKFFQEMQKENHDIQKQLEENNKFKIISSRSNKSRNIEQQYLLKGLSSSKKIIIQSNSPIKSTRTIKSSKNVKNFLPKAEEGDLKQRDSQISHFNRKKNTTALSSNDIKGLLEKESLNNKKLFESLNYDHDYSMKDPLNLRIKFGRNLNEDKVLFAVNSNKFAHKLFSSQIEKSQNNHLTKVQSKTDLLEPKAVNKFNNEISEKQKKFKVFHVSHKSMYQICSNKNSKVKEFIFS